MDDGLTLGLSALRLAPKLAPLLAALVAAAPLTPARPVALAPRDAARSARSSAPSSPSRDATLAVLHRGVWREWWRVDRAPRRWSGPLPLLTDAVVWRRAGEGLEWGELHLSGSGEAWRLGAVLIRVDPRHFDFRLAANVREDRSGGPWSVELAPAGAALALNAGQFTDEGPWGWVVHKGREIRPPGTGPLSMALLIAPDGGIRWVTGDRIAEAHRRGELAGAVEALQSYPTLLSGDGDVPAPLLAAGRGVDLEHRDGRFAIGELRDGRILIALTRFKGLGGALSALPFGPTVPETSALMGALGCRAAMMLDGGLSAQLLLRTDSGEEHRWSGLRQVPLGLVALRKGVGSR